MMSFDFLINSEQSIILVKTISKVKFRRSNVRNIHLVLSN